MLKVLTKVAPDELKQWAKGQWERFKTLLNKAVENLPDGNRQVVYDDNELIATLIGGGVTVQPEVYEARSIGGIRQRPGWSITSWKHELETEYAPADFVPSDEKITSNTIGATVIAVKLAFDVLLEDWGSRQSDDEFAQQLEEERTQ
jgi:hypothetical protein